MLKLRTVLSFFAASLVVIAAMLIIVPKALAVEKGDEGCNNLGEGWSCGFFIEKGKGGEITDPASYETKTGLCKSSSDVNYICYRKKTDTSGGSATAAATQAPEPFALGDVAAGLNTTAQGLPRSTSIANSIGKLIQNILGLVGVLLFGFILYAGVKWMTAGGDSKATQDSITIIRNSAVGMLIIVFSYAIADYVLQAITKAMTGG